MSTTYQALLLFGYQIDIDLYKNGSEYPDWFEESVLNKDDIGIYYAGDIKDNGKKCFLCVIVDMNESIEESKELSLEEYDIYQYTKKINNWIKKHNINSFDHEPSFHLMLTKY